MGQAEPLDTLEDSYPHPSLREGNRRGQVTWGDRETIKVVPPLSWFSV